MNASTLFYIVPMLCMAQLDAADLTSAPWKLIEFPQPGRRLQFDMVFTSQTPTGQNYRLTGYIACYWQGATSCFPQSITATLWADGRIAITVPLPGPDDRAWPWLAFYDGQMTGDGIQFTNGTVWYYGGGAGSWSAFTVPRLGVSRFSSAQMQVTWPTNFDGYVLEQATSLPSASWTAVTNRVVTTSDSFSVTIGAGAPQRFFRLRKP